MTKQEQFFFDHAGFGYDPATETEEQGKTRTAKELARAETWAVQEGHTFVEVDDTCIGGDFGPCSTGEPHECVAILMLDDTEDEDVVVQSLGGICDADRDYKRVVRAELALEQMFLHEVNARGAK